MSRPFRYRISEILERDANNLDLVRLLSAAAVIYGHSWLIFGPADLPEQIADPSRIFGYEGVYAASLAVKVFFFISGLLVTHSLLTRRSVFHFVVARFFRVWPALLVVVAVTALVLGPIFTHLSCADYFRHFSVYRYLTGNAMMQHPDTLPGVFVDNNLPFSVNGSLWSLKYEIAAYLALLVLGLLGGLRHRRLCALVFLALALDPLLDHGWLSTWLGSNPQMIYLPFCFALGAMIALAQDRIVLTPAGIGMMLIAFLALSRTLLGPLLCFATFFTVLLYLSALPWVRRFRPARDLSYGTFLWGFPIQQMLAAKFSHLGLFAGFFLSLAGALACAWVSWSWIEKPALKLGRRVARWCVQGETVPPPLGEIAR